MLTVHPSTIAARRKLFLQMEAGTLTREQAFQQALELDPNDWLALGALAMARQISPSTSTWPSGVKGSMAEAALPTRASAPRMDFEAPKGATMCETVLL